MGVPANDETELVQQASRGDMGAFEVLVIRYQSYVYNLALRVVGQPDEAEDLAQQAFIRAWRGLAQFRGESKFSTWLYRIVTNLCYNRLPRLKQDLAAMDAAGETLELADEHQEIEAAYSTTEVVQSLQRAIANLPESYRLLITLRHLQEMSYEEIAQVTGMPLGTVKTGIFRARQQLKAAMELFEVQYA